MAAAAVLETLTVPRSSALPSVSLAPTVASSFSSRRSFPGFSRFKGLRIQPTRLSFTLSSTAKSARRGGRIVCEAQDTAVDAVPPLTEAQWQSYVLESDLPVLVEFWAPWCGPCRMIQAAINELATQYVGKLKFYKVNTDDCPGIATQYGIRSIPTVMIFKGGEKKEAIIGAVPKTTLTTSIEKFL